jgi:hypothetical protein
LFLIVYQISIKKLAASTDDDLLNMATAIAFKAPVETPLIDI